MQCIAFIFILSNVSICLSIMICSSVCLIVCLLLGNIKTFIFTKLRIIQIAKPKLATLYFVTLTSFSVIKKDTNPEYFRSFSYVIISKMVTYMVQVSRMTIAKKQNSAYSFLIGIFTYHLSPLYRAKDQEQFDSEYLINGIFTYDLSPL